MVSYFSRICKTLIKMVNNISIITATTVNIIAVTLTFDTIAEMIVNVPRKHAIIFVLSKHLVFALLSSLSLLIYPYLIDVSCFALTAKVVNSCYILIDDKWRFNYNIKIYTLLKNIIKKLQIWLELVKF